MSLRLKIGCEEQGNEYYSLCCSINRLEILVGFQLSMRTFPQEFFDVLKKKQKVKTYVLRRVILVSEI